MEKKPRILCRRCNQETNHSFATQHEVNWGGESEYAVSGSTQYQLLSCDGCGGFTFRKRTWCSEWFDPEDGHWPSDELLYLEDIHSSWLSDPAFALSGKIDAELLLEANRALAFKCPSASCLALRAFVERMLVKSVRDCGSIAGNLKEYSKNGFVSKPQEEALNAVIEAGHAVMHRGHRPSEADVGTWLEVIEGIVKTNYYDPLEAKSSTRKLPKRSGPK